MKTDAVAAAVSEALRLVNRSNAGWPEEAVEHAARRAAELAREEERERWFRAFTTDRGSCAMHMRPATVAVELRLLGIGTRYFYLCPECVEKLDPAIAAALRAGSGE